MRGSRGMSLERNPEMLRQNREVQLGFGRRLSVEVEVHLALSIDRELRKLPVSEHLVVGVVGRFELFAELHELCGGRMIHDSQVE